MTRRPDLEARLDQLPGVTWRYERNLPVDSLDLPSSANLQYRLTDVDQPTVDRYAEDMARGDRFPALIVREVRGKHELIGGNHRRAAAAQAAIAALSAYLVGCSPAQARILSFEDNRTHGLAVTATERAVLGARLVLLDGVPTGQAAAVVGCPAPMVTNAIAAHRATERAEQLGLPAGFAALAMSTRERLQSIDDDGLFAEAARTVLATNMGGNLVAGLVRQVNTADGEEDAYDRIDAVAAARQGHAGGRGNRRNDLSRLTDHLFQLLDVDPAKAAAGVLAGDEQVWRDRLKKVAVHLMEIDRQLVARARREAA